MNFNQLSPGVFAGGFKEELNNFFNLTQNLRSDFSWGFGLNSVVDNPFFALKLRFPVLSYGVMRLAQLTSHKSQE